MIYPENNLTKNPQKTIAMVFGFKEHFDLINKGEKSALMKNVNKHYCMMCGRVQDEGYIDPKKELIQKTTNDFYDFIRPHSPFLCKYCLYVYRIWKKDMQKRTLGIAMGDTSNIILYKDRFEEKNFNKDANNELYDLFIEPPKEAFAILVKNRKGNVFENAFNSFVPTVDSELFVINYGFTQYFAPREKVLECLDEIEEVFQIAKDEKINLSKETLLNSMTKGYEDYIDWLSHNVRGNEVVFGRYLEFINKYDKGVRFTASMLYERYLAEKLNKA